MTGYRNWYIYRVCLHLCNIKMPGKFLPILMTKWLHMCPLVYEKILFFVFRQFLYLDLPIMSRNKTLHITCYHTSLRALLSLLCHTIEQMMQQTHFIVLSQHYHLHHSERTPAKWFPSWPFGKTTWQWSSRCLYTSPPFYWGILWIMLQAFLSLSVSTYPNLAEN